MAKSPHPSTATSEQEVKQEKRRKLPKAAEPYKFKPGQSGNPGGRPKKKPLTELYEKLLSDKEFIAELESSVKKMVTSGRMVGQLQLKEMAERVEGKVAQPLKHEGDITITLADRLKKARERRGSN